MKDSEEQQTGWTEDLSTATTKDRRQQKKQLPLDGGEEEIVERQN